MNDKQLADRVVALGVGRQGKYPKSRDGVGFYFTPKGEDGSDEGMYSALFVHDWRVAGALMEKCRNIHIYWDDIDFSVDACGPPVSGQITGRGLVDALDKNFYPLPRAIIEACVEALTPPEA